MSEPKTVKIRACCMVDAEAPARPRSEPGGRMSTVIVRWVAVAIHLCAIWGLVVGSVVASLMDTGQRIAFALAYLVVAGASLWFMWPQLTAADRELAAWRGDA